MDLTTYFEKFKAIKKVAEELNQSANGHAVVEKMCRELDINQDDIEEAEATKFIADRKERILGMQLIMNADCNKYGTLIKDYDREYLGGINKYPKTLQDAYNLLKGQNTHEATEQKHPSKVGTSFHTLGEVKESGDALLNDGAKHPPCSRCGRTNHTLDKCIARKHED